MAITAAKYTSMWSTSNSDADYLTSDEISEMTSSFTNNDYINDKPTLAMLGPVMHQIQKMQDELTYLRGLISTNKDKAAFPGLGTSNSTALAGDTTTISTAQANAITANTAKTGITSNEQKDIGDNKTSIATNISEIAKSNTNISTNTNAIATSIKVGAYPSVPSGVAQSHTSEIIYDSKNKKYFINIYYIEDVPGKGGGKGTRTIRTGQVELK
jgi:hypothetical protein